MGANFTALFDYSINSQDLIDIPTKLNDKEQFRYFYSVVDSLDDTKITRWEWPKDIISNRTVEEEFLEEGFVSMGGPGGFVFYVGKHLCELSSYIRWGTFLESMEIQNHFRKISLEFSRIFGNPLYAPDLFCLDSYLFDEESIDEAKKWLIKEYGPPSNSINEMIIDSRKINEFRKYFIEDFKE
ncbi:hypothetical protein AB6A23_12610 [Paenibacillus tarimensis]